MKKTPVELLSTLNEIVPEFVWPRDITIENSRRGNMVWRYRGGPISPQCALDIVVGDVERWLLNNEWHRGPKAMTVFSEHTGGKDIFLIKAVRRQVHLMAARPLTLNGSG